MLGGSWIRRLFIWIGIRFRVLGFFSALVFWLLFFIRFGMILWVLISVFFGIRDIIENIVLCFVIVNDRE